MAPETDFSKGLELEMPPSPPVSLHHLTSVTETLGMPSFGHSPPQTQTHPSKSNNPSRAPEMVPAKTQTGPETPSKKSADKAVSVEAAERDWEEKRAALTQYSAKDINRLLEETQAELMKAIPDLEFAAKHKQSTGSSSAASTPEHKPSKPQHAQKSTGKVDPNGRRGSDELTVPRYRTEKPSKSPPPPPPRRSFPSSHGLTTTRSGEVIVTSKKEGGFMKKAESEELETQKPQVKLRRTVSEVVRPASTPPIIASAIKDDDDEDRIIAELEVFQRSSASPGHADVWPNAASVAAEGWKELAAPAPPGSRAFSLPQIVLTECTSAPPSPDTEPEVWVEAGSSQHGDPDGSRGAGGQRAANVGRRCQVSAGSPGKSPCTAPALQPPSTLSWSCAPGGTRRIPLADSRVPALSKNRASWPAAGGGALKAAGRQEGSSKTSPLAEHPPCPQGEVTALITGAGSKKPGITLQHPGDAQPRGAAGQDAPLPPCKQEEQCSSSPVPTARCCPAQRGSGWGWAGHPPCTASQGQSSVGPSPGAGELGTEGFCHPSPPGRSDGDASPLHSMSPRSKEIYEGTYQRLDSLEETIRELEMTISEISSHPSAERMFPKELLGQAVPKDAGKEMEEGVQHPECSGHDDGTTLDLSPTKTDAPKSSSLRLSQTKPPLLPKPQPPLGTPQSGGVSIPAMKMVNPASRLKQSQQGSPDKSKHIKQRMEYMRIQGQQQVAYL
ncbi:SRCN1 inhibitor, partial [Penelope pileata]|nr:SRCN1 inhibitor [Penelope pileata]